MVYINWDGFAWHYYRQARAGKASGTPVLDGLAGEGVLFTDAFSGIPSITNPMQTAIVTGAWPDVTGNCYRYYDRDKNIVVELGRYNRAENIAEAAARQGVRVMSVHQFILENRGTRSGSRTHPYILAGKRADYSARFNAAIKLVKKDRLFGGAPPCPEGRRVLLALYMDDLDGLGHNAWFTYGIPAAGTEAGRLKNIRKRLCEMDAKLGEFIRACKEADVYESMSFLLATDHGMTPYGRQSRKPDGFGYSKLPDLKGSLRGLGCTVEVLSPGESASADTDIVLVTEGLEVQLSAAGDKRVNIDGICEALKNKPYIGRCMKKRELEAGGAMDGFADLLISPLPPYCFKDDYRLHRAGGQHDSLDDSSRHVFALMWGRGIKKGCIYDKRIHIIDFAKTMSHLLGIDPPEAAAGRLLRGALCDNR